MKPVTTVARHATQSTIARHATPPTVARHAATQPTERLISWRGILPFILMILIAITYAVPSAPELAEFYFKSYDSKTAEEILNQSGSQTPRTLSRKVDVLAYEGRYDQAHPLIEALVRAKPRNIEYRQKQISVLRGLGRFLDAIRIKEEMIELAGWADNRVARDFADGRVPRDPYNKAQAYLELAQDYQWQDSTVDILRVFKKIETNNLMTPEILPLILPKMIGILVAIKHQDAALALLDRFPLTSHALLYRAVARVYMDLHEYEKSVYAAARALGAGIQAAKEAPSDGAFIHEVSDGAFTEFHAFSLDVVNVYNLQKKYELSEKLFSRLEALKLLSLEDRFNYVDVLLELKKTDAAKDLLARIAEGAALPDMTWRMIASRLALCKEHKAAAAILKALLDGETPRVRR